MIQIEKGEIEAIIQYLRLNATMAVAEPIVLKMNGWLERDDKPKVSLAEIPKDEGSAQR